jgi:hypothetical protein
MDPRRQHRRYNVDVPVEIQANGGRKVLIPDEIGLGSCYFRFRPPKGVGAASKTVQILLDQPIAPKNVEYFDRKNVLPKYRNVLDGFGFKWDIERNDVARFEDKLQANDEVKETGKIEFITREQDYLLRDIRHREESRLSRVRLLFVMILAYLAYLIAPYKFLPTHVNAEFAAFYALGGIWAAISLTVYTQRLVRFCGVSFRNKVMAYKAINLNRAYLFANDDAYYNHTIFPIGETYDESRVWSYSTNSDQNRNEKYPSEVPKSGYPPMYFFFLEGLFVGGLIHFIGMLVRAFSGSSFMLDEQVVSLSLSNLILRIFPTASILTSGHISSLDLFSKEYFQISFIGSIGIIVLWIQLAGNQCLRYHRLVWEAKRIKIERPNPRYTGRALWSYKPLKYFFRAVPWMLAVYALSCSLYFVPAIRASESVFVGHWFSVWGTCLAAGLFFLIKIAYVYTSIYFEKRTYDNEAVPVLKAEENDD